MATYAIGDIQGCREALERLLEAIGFDPARDRLWFAGDLVNRGPDSLGTLRLVRDLGDRAITVLGNHDLHLLAVASGAEPARSSDHLDDVLAAPDRDELLDWLRHRPLLHHDPRLGYTLVHAGLPPQWDLATARACATELEAVLRGPDHADFFDHMYGDHPRRWDPDLRGRDRLRFITNCLTRMRYCDRSGNLDLASKGPPGTQPSPFLPWFRIPDRASAGLRIVFGHWSTLGPHDGHGVHALDTGCLWGGRLTALRLGRTPERITIGCGRSHGMSPARGDR